MTEQPVDFSTVSRLLSEGIIDAPFLADLLAIFKRDSELILNDLSDSLVAGKLDDFHNRMHALHGIAGNIYANELAVLCKQFCEIPAHEFANIDKDELPEALRTAIRKTELAYRDFLVRFQKNK
jgi:hypothetical protein